MFCKNDSCRSSQPGPVVVRCRLRMRPVPRSHPSPEEALVDRLEDASREIDEAGQAVGDGDLQREAELLTARSDREDHRRDPAAVHLDLVR